MIRKSIQGNVMSEFCIGLIFIFFILNLSSDIWGSGNIFFDMKNAYELFLNKFNSTILNLDVIP